MADHFYGRIEIGGALRRADLPRFCNALEAVDEFDLVRFLADGHIVKEDDDARYGQFEDLEALCHELGLPYIRQSDGRYEFSPEIVFWQPGMSGPDSAITDHAGNAQVDMDHVREIRDALRAGNMPEALRLAEDAIVELPVLPPFHIVA